MQSTPRALAGVVAQRAHATCNAALPMSPEHESFLGALVRLARGLDDDRTLAAVAARSVALGRTLGSGRAHITLRAPGHRGATSTITLGDALDPSRAAVQLEVPISSGAIEGMLSLSRAQDLAPIEPLHLALLGALIGSAAARSTLIDQLVERDLERRELIAKISHDIRTPLQSFSLGLDAVKMACGSDPASEKMATTFARMQRSVTSLGHVVDDVEDASFVYDDTLTLHVAAHAPDVLVERACATRATAALARGSSIVIEKSGLAPLSCDGPRIARVISILVDNALRYSRRGATVTLRVVALPNGVRFEVQDDGPGVASEVRERIFAQPYRAKAAGRVGLGLYLASAIAKAHGGSIHLSPEGASGVTFALEIPRVRPAAGGTNL